MLLIFVTFVCIATYLILHKRVIQFTSFFVTEKYYKRLQLNLKASIVDHNINPSAQKSDQKSAMLSAQKLASRGK